MNKSIKVTSEYRVNERGAVFDECGKFYCMWFVLTDEEKEIVKQKEFSERQINKQGK